VAPQGTQRTRNALSQGLPGEEASHALALANLLAAELDQYAEIIAGARGGPIGFMTRGEDAGFTERAHQLLRQLAMPEAAIAHHRALATWFEHMRAFLKVEWHVLPDGIQPLAACYFRRRPEIETALARFHALGVAPEVQDHVRRIAFTLEKDSIHFVSAAFRPGHPVHHKLYFSQWAEPGSRHKVEERIERMFDRHAISEPVRARWRALHEGTLPEGDPTLFLSISFTDREVLPSFKIDYPEVTPDVAAAWLDGTAAAQAASDAAHTCELAGARALSYLGVRFTPGEDAVRLKYYADVPGSA
jgi:hypothetical protein